jgi:hypothetical protein
MFSFSRYFTVCITYQPTLLSKDEKYQITVQFNRGLFVQQNASLNNRTFVLISRKPASSQVGHQLAFDKSKQKTSIIRRNSANNQQQFHAKMLTENR